jgi:N-acetylglucosaminyl transferase component (Gpi1)
LLVPVCQLPSFRTCFQSCKEPLSTALSSLFALARRVVSAHSRLSHLRRNRVLIHSRTLHIYSFYLASARIFNWQYTILLSLFQLFRGKKHNVLRKRIDSCDYDLDQLLLGTILFTLLFFLLPTVVVFYLTFACSRMAIISLKAALDTLLACLNHFPLFALMLRIKDSQRLPGMPFYDI